MFALLKCLSEVVKLKIRHDKKGQNVEEDLIVRSEQVEKDKWQTFGLQQLNDLQSKLMLVAGKAQEGRHEVDRFVEVIHFH